MPLYSGLLAEADEMVQDRYFVNYKGIRDDLIVAVTGTALCQAAEVHPVWAGRAPSLKGDGAH